MTIIGSIIPGLGGGGTPSTPGGVDRSVQYNDLDTFGGSPNYKYTETSDFATITLESISATGGGGLIINNSSAFQRLNIIYSEVLGKTIIESILNDIDITTDSTLTINYSGSSAVFDDTTGNNSLTLNSSASNKDVGFYLNDSTGNNTFSVVHNDVSGQTSLQIKNDVGNTKFATTFNQTLDDIFITSGSGASLYLISADTLTLESNDTMLIETLGDYAISIKNDNAIFNINSSSADYSFGFSNQEPSTDPLFIWAKDDVSGGVCRVYLRNATPEGAITAAGGSLCIRSSGTSSNIYLKLSDATNTDWQSLLGDVIGPTTSTDNGLALFNGITGELLKSTSNITILESATINEIFFKLPSGGTNNQITFENFAGSRLTLFEFDDLAIQTTLYSSGASHRLILQSDGAATLRSFNDFDITLSNNNASYIIFNSTQNYLHRVQNNQPNTNALIRFAQTGINGGQSQFYFSTIIPEGVITGNGGDICIVDAGTNSDIYLKRSDASNTGWVDLLHSSSGIKGPTISTDTAIATWNGTDGLNLNDSYGFLSSDANNTRLSIDNVSISGQSGIQIRNHLSEIRYSVIYNQTLGDIFVTTALGINYDLTSNGRINISALSSATFGSSADEAVTINNNNATLLINDSAQNYRFDLTNNQPNTNPLIRFIQSGTNGGQSRFFFSTLAPEGIITGNGGDICIRDAGISSDIYLKRSDGTNTGWVDLLHSSSGIKGPVISTDNALAVWDGVDGLTLQDSYTSLVSTGSSTVLSVKNVSATGQSGFAIQNSFGFDRYSLTYNQSTNAVFMTTNSGTSYSNVVDGSLEHLSNSNVAIGSFGNQTVELYNTNATLRLDTSANGGRLFFSNIAADTAEMIRLFKAGTNGGATEIYLTSRTPTGNITGNGGDICIRDAGTSSNVYIKRVDGGTTGWNVALTSPVETSTLNAIPAFDVTTGNSLQPVNTATLFATSNTTVLELKPVLSTGNGEINFRTTAGNLKTQVYYYEVPDTFNIEANVSKLNIGNFGGPISFASLAGDTDLYVRTSSPAGVVTGNPGDLSIVTSGINSAMYLHEGAAANNTDWSRIVTVGNRLNTRSYSVNPIAGGTYYYGGYYQAPATSVTLTIGGTVTQTFGVANVAYGAHAFCVAAGPGGTDLVLTVTGISISDAGVRNDADSEIIVADTDQATTNQYFETSKRWLGQVTYTLTGAAGSFTFNYGFAKYEKFSKTDFVIKDLIIEGLADGNEAGLDVSLLKHQTTGWTYSAAAFTPGTTPVIDLATDYSVNDQLADNNYFAYERSDINVSVSGSSNEGILVRLGTVNNNVIQNATINITVLN
jgi:hypothetical protein